MLRLIVEAAIKWINVGLPLRDIKIVIYSRNPAYPGSSEIELANCFQYLKNNWMMVKDKNSVIHKVSSIRRVFLLAVLYELLSIFIQISGKILINTVLRSN